MSGIHYIGAMLLAVGPFLAELLSGILIFSTRFRRREHFFPRMAVAFAAELLAGCAVYCLCYFSDFWFVSNTLCYLGLFALALLVPFFCFRERPATLILCAVSGYMTQHIGSQLLQMTRLWWGYEMWSDTRVELSWLFRIYMREAFVFGIVAAAVYFLAARRMTGEIYSGAVERSMLWLSVTTLTVVLVLSSVRDVYARESYALMVVSRLFSIFCCAFLLYIRSDVLEKSRLEQEREQLRSLYEKERERYEQSRENIELINIKCHDMKRRIEGWERSGGQIPTEEIREIRQLIGIYDSTVRTGSDTLDTILTERSLYCERHGIRLSCIADGNLLSFMPVGDICALFGNALENAIEAVSKLERREERNISFLVRESRGMMVALIENCFAGGLIFEDGLPQTTKGDAGWHGFGLKSIRRVAEKYGGEITVSADEMFHLSILIPLPEPEIRQNL